MVAMNGVLTLDDARDAGLTKDQVYAEVAAGRLERIGRGVYLDPTAVDPSLASLAGVTTRQARATMCLTSALVWHGLSDAIPFATDIALPRGTRHPAAFEHVAWHSFDTATFDVGRTPLQTVGGVEVFVYSPERTIVDCFRLAHREGADQAALALRRWLRDQHGVPSQLLNTTRSFPRVAGQIRRALEILL
jgi:predicted transcriptional regulator of viral defense system